MTIHSDYRQWVTVIVFVLLAAPLCTIQTSQASSPRLILHLLDGPGQIYDVGDIEWIDFAGDTLHVVGPGGMDGYPAGAIDRIEFQWDQTGVIDPGDAAAAVRFFHLFPNRPNPGSPGTDISFNVPRSGPVAVRVYGVDGRLIRTLVDESLPVGTRSVHWNGRDESGRRVASGVYFYRLRAPGIDESRKMILLR